MLTDNDCRKERADRTFVRTAIFTHRRPINFSIRARVGEFTRGNHKLANTAIDNCMSRPINTAIEWPAIEFVNTEEAIYKIGLHRRKCPKNLRWFAGVHVAPRIHPWDEQELPFSTKAWIDIATDTPEEAQKIAQSLFQLGCSKSPIHADTSFAKHVFAYALSIDSLN